MNDSKSDHPVLFSSNLIETKPNHSFYSDVESSTDSRSHSRSRSRSRSRTSRSRSRSLSSSRSRSASRSKSRSPSRSRSRSVSKSRSQSPHKDVQTHAEADLDILLMPVSSSNNKTSGNNDFLDDLFSVAAVSANVPNTENSKLKVEVEKEVPTENVGYGPTQELLNSKTCGGLQIDYRFVRESRSSLFNTIALRFSNRSDRALFDIRCKDPVFILLFCFYYKDYRSLHAI